MNRGVALLNFGEPERLDLEGVSAFLERILCHARILETGSVSREERARCRESAQRRAPGLLQDYLATGGSPLRRQAEGQRQALVRELTNRGHGDVGVYLGMQFSEPSIESAVAQAQADGVTRLVGFPVYPLCGPTTTVAALGKLEAAVDRSGGGMELRGLTGWHTHPAYTGLRADGVRDTLRQAGLDLGDRQTRLLFIAHGTPLKHLRAGSRYQRYVLDHCHRIAEDLGAGDYLLGYQNHAGGNVQWTQPEVNDLIAGLDPCTVVAVPVSFMHEQNETLYELDIQLRQEAESAGLRFLRVAVPHDDPRFARLLADLLVPLLCDDDPRSAGLMPCQCKPGEGIYCLNTGLEA